MAVCVCVYVGVWVTRAAGGRLIVHYCKEGNPGAGQETVFFTKTLERFTEVHYEHPFDILHMESAALRFPDYQPFNLPIVSSWHGVL